MVASKEFVRATRPALLCASPTTNNKFTRNNIMITITSTVEALNRTIEARKKRPSRKAQPLPLRPHYRGMPHNCPATIISQAGLPRLAQELHESLRVDADDSSDSDSDDNGGIARGSDARKPRGALERAQTTKTTAKRRKGWSSDYIYIDTAATVIPIGVPGSLAPTKNRTR